MAIFRSVMITSVLCFVVPTSARRDVLVASSLGEQASVNDELASDAGGELTQANCILLKPGGKPFKDSLLEDGLDGGKVCHLKFLHGVCKRKLVPKYCDTIFSTDPIIAGGGKFGTDAKFEKSGCKCEYVKPADLEREPSQHSKEPFSCFLAASGSHDQVVNAGETKKEPVIDKVESIDDRVETVDDANGETTSNVVKPVESWANILMGRLTWQTKLQGSMWVRYGDKEVKDTWAVFTPSAGLKKFELGRETVIQTKTNTNKNLLAGWAAFFKEVYRKGQGDITVTAVDRQSLQFAILQKDGSVMFPQVGTTFDITSGQAAAAYLFTQADSHFAGTLTSKQFASLCRARAGIGCESVTF